MKNIHLLKTSKPSKLLKDLVDKTYQFKKEDTFGNRIELPLNIYITSDEEIKEGDWCIDDEGIVKCTAHAGAMNHYYTKIILTTDDQLIKDGVQGIDDEFLEWFVKNPNYEFVEVDLIPYDGTKSISKYWNGEYKIIIPKEEPKQETLLQIANRKLMSNDWLNGAEFGAKWQQQQDKNKYSEQDLLNAFDAGLNYMKDGNLNKNEWFKQFKNK
jgi:hypothetical protein